ncbi:hypothetical protein PHYPSEUDO_014620 [Phytophthora pseudosyringae]|uniref:Homologous recombination OB-fold protein OB-fold domain-containing protein n=1 Tax=Phytophthora pseudosyringae TaxID=221518 RepID=A0A8T1V441_9STRA|nr:hypothetical protein PHYPSEUDO_014620 [Phytophthora pseudosyringae]
MSGSEDEGMAPDGGADGTLGGKRLRSGEDEDLGSQQSILKWMRHVPGPLQDVMKKRADQLDNSQGDHSRIASANSDRYSVAIATVFDQGSWVDMCLYLGLPAVSGTLYGSIKIGSLKCTLGSIVDGDEALAKIPQLLVLIKSVRYVDEQIVAELHDPTGEVEGYFHRELVEQLGPALVVGVGVLLYKVSVFTPTDAPVTGRRKSYLNITPRNVRRVFIAKEQTNSSTDDPVEVFNREKEVASQQESDSDDYDDNQASRSEQAARQLLQHSTVRDTSAELTFLSQRQVIHRNPPVRLDPAEAATTTKKKGKRGKGTAASKNQDQESGLGKWQWSKLLKKTNDDESAADSSRSQERRSFLDASSRLVSLITKQNARIRGSTPEEKSNNQEAPPASTRPKKSVGVRFAPGTVFDPPSIPRNSDNYDLTELTQRSPSSEPCHSQTHPVKPLDADSKNNNSDEDDEDDDW